MSTMQNNTSEHHGRMVVDSLDAWDRATPEARAIALEVLRGGQRQKGRIEDVTLDTINSDVHHLYELLDTAVDISCQMDGYVHPVTGERNKDLDRIAALLWIARDLAEQIGSNIEEGFPKLREQWEEPAE